MSLKINDELKIIFLHIPKTGGMFITFSLINYYNFKEHQKINDDNTELQVKKKCVKFIESGYTHLLTPQILNYKFFACVRNPYERFISGYLYVEANSYGFLNVNDTIRNLENFKNGLCYYMVCDLNIYIHLFITQTDFIKNYPNVTILQFDNLNSTFCDFLLKNGVTEIKHPNLIVNKVEYKNTKFWEYYDSYTLNFVNNYFDNDFKNFGFEKYHNVNDLYYHMIKKHNTYKIY